MGNAILLECFPSPTSGFYNKAVGRIEKKFRYFLAYLANALTKKLLFCNSVDQRTNAPNTDVNCYS